MAYFATFLILHLHFKHKFVPSGYRIVDQASQAAVYLAIVAWATTVAYSRYESSRYQSWSHKTDMHVSEVLSILPFRIANTLGSFHWHQFWSQLLYRHRTNSKPKTKLFARESANIPFDEPCVHMAANTRWLGSVVGQRYRRPMAVMATGMEKADKDGTAYELDSIDLYHRLGFSRRCLLPPPHTYPFIPPLKTTKYGGIKRLRIRNP